jgi:CRISPR-associated protein Csx17
VANSNQPLPVIPLPGLRLEVLGNYLASLGLLRLLARKWPSVRIAWRDGVLQVVGGPSNLDELLDWLVDVAQKREWTPYERAWLKAKTKSSSTQSGKPLAVWQAHEASEQILELFCAHVVATRTRSVNPLLADGTFSNSRRVFANGWSKAVDALAPPSLPKPTKNDSEKRKKREDAYCQEVNEKRKRDQEALKAYLLDQPTSVLVEQLNAASWFSSANKLYNSGQSAYREEPLSPWAMALACEGLPFFAGAASRRLGARARAQGAFPFVCQAGAPKTAGEAGRDRGEVWAPVWERPMTLPEVRVLFQRGRAEVRGRAANTPAAFAVAIVQRGVDAGISGFARFALGATTSAKTFEPRHQGTIAVHHWATGQAAARARSDMVERILALLDRLPRDCKKGKRWWFFGLRGPIEAALVRVAQTPDDAVALCELLDAVVAALDRVDRNVGHREKRVQWQPLPVECLPALFGRTFPSIEARLAGALVSAFPASRPFAIYRFGVEQKLGRFEHPQAPPARWVFRAGPLSRLLSDVLLRATLDRERDTKTAAGTSLQLPLLPLTVSASDVQDWLAASVDEALLAGWLGRLALFDWRHIPQDLRKHWQIQSGDALSADGPLLLAGLLQPLFDARPLRLPAASAREDALSDETGARTPGAARTIATLIRTKQIDTAVRLARSRYAMANLPLVRAELKWDVTDPDRFLAALLFPIHSQDRHTLVERWLRPQRQKGAYADV